MPTTAQIVAADTTLSELARAQWLALIHNSAAYREQPGLYPSLADRLSDVTAIQAQQLNAALALIDAIGDGTVAVSPVSGDGTDYSQDRDREALITYGISVLYDQPVRASSVAVAQMNNPLRGSVSWCAHHRMAYAACGCWL
jgi:hypothetical protein